jgi:hypothetical protein
MKSKKYGQVRKLVNRSDEDDRFAATVFCNHSRAKNMKLAGGYRSQSGKTFLLFLDFSDEEYIDALSHVVLTKEGKQWQLENCSGDWDPFW